MREAANFSCIVRHIRTDNVQIATYSLDVHYLPGNANVIVTDSQCESVTFTCLVDANPKDVTHFSLIYLLLFSHMFSLLKTGPQMVHQLLSDVRYDAVGHNDYSK